MSNKKNTLYVNLWGGPGSGKSTGAAYLFSQLKIHGVDCEYVQEYAKDTVWEDHQSFFRDPVNQFCIGAEQLYRLNNLNGKVDVVVTDAPLMLSPFYVPEQYQTEYQNLFLKLNSSFRTLNVFVERVSSYDPNGRLQTEQEADELGKKLKHYLDNLAIDCIPVKGSTEGYEFLLKYMMQNCSIPGFSADR